MDEEAGSGVTLVREATHTRQLTSVTVAVCTKERLDDLHRCLTAITNLPNLGQAILVIDNSRSGSAVTQYAATFPGVQFLHEPRSGLNRARNRALQAARPGIVAFIDDDAVPEADWLAALLANFDASNVLAVTGLTLPLELETPAQCWFERISSLGRGFKRRTFDRATLKPARAGWVGAGTNMALRTSLVDHVGLFDEALDAGTPTLSGGTMISSPGFWPVATPSSTSQPPAVIIATAAPGASCAAFSMAMASASAPPGPAAC